VGQILADFTVEFEAEDFEALAFSLESFEQNVEYGMGSRCHRYEMNLGGLDHKTL
jgi:hypothetical protein